jgi:nicotinamidase/pyrazinamidase
MKIAIEKTSDVLIVVDQQLDFEPGGFLPVAHGDEIVSSINQFMGPFAEVILTADWHPRGHISFASSYLNRQPYQSITLAEVQTWSESASPLSPLAKFSLAELRSYLTKVSDQTQSLWPDHCVQGSHGAKLDAKLNRDRGTLLLRKGYRANADSYSAFFENDGVDTGLASFLKAKGMQRVFVVGLAGDFCVARTALDARKKDFEVYCIEDLTRSVNLPGTVDAAQAALLTAGVHIVNSRQF